MGVPVDAVLAVASGAATSALGVSLLVLRPWQRDRTLFGAFALTLGVQFIAANVGTLLQSGAVHAVWFPISLALTPAATLLLTHFAVRTGPAGPRWPTSLAAGLAILAGLLFVLAPQTLLAGPRVAGAFGATAPGPWALPVLILPFFGAFYLTLALLYRAFRTARPGSERHRVRGLLLALSLLTSYQTGGNLVQALRAAPGTPFSVQVGSIALFGSGLLIVAGIAAHHVRRPPHPERVDPMVVGALTIPGVVGLVENLLGSPIPSWGAWRILMVIVVVHTLARHRLFGLDIRLRNLVGPVAAAFLGVLTIVSVIGALAGWGEGPAGRGVPDIPATVSYLAIGGVATFVTWDRRDRIGAALFPGALAEPSYIRQRKIEVYLHALQDTPPEGRAVNSPVLKRLRRELDISEREHAVLTYAVDHRAPSPTGDPAAGTETPVMELPRVRPGSTVRGHFVQRLLGEGAHGRAYLASADGAARVLKVVGANAIGGRGAELLAQEHEVLRGLDHPNVVAALELWQGPYEAVMVLEYVDGGNVQGLLARRRRLGVYEAATLVAGVVAGLGAAHAAGIVHRDLKPENILITKTGEPKVSDFGVAARPGDQGTGLLAGAWGTLLFMAPEQVRGVAVDARADLYAVAALLHLLVTGHHYLPVTGKDDHQVRSLILDFPADLGPKDAPAWFRDFLRRGLSKAPADRFTNATAMLEALQVGLGSAPPTR